MSAIKKVGVLGCGNMATAIMMNWAKNTKGSDISFYLYTPTQIKAKSLAQKIEGMVSVCVENSYSFVSEMDMVVLGFKPQKLSLVSKEIKSLLKPSTIIYSMLAGTSIESLKKSLGVSNVVRTMPNTPMLVGEGINLVCYSSPFEKELKVDVEQILKSISYYYFIPESYFDVMTPVIGSGPAYLFLLGELLRDFLVQKGIDDALSTDLVQKVLYGSALLWSSKGSDPKELRKNVTSKKGVTEKVVESLKNSHLREILFDALEKGVKRSEELGELK